MPCVLKVRILAARNLPVMDRATELTDAFVEVHFSDYDHVRTQICKRTLDPVWNEDFRFEVTDDAELQREPLEIRVLDYDQISYHDSIGHLFLDLNALLTWDSTSQIAGWFPIYDTLCGIRGELHISVKLALFGDLNPFKDSSAGVKFFTLPTIPETCVGPTVLGFVAALDNENDPEYSWSDNFRTPRTSNEERTRKLFKLSGNIRRQLGKKVLELGGNAVVGFKQFFDFETERRSITVRAIGTAVRLSPAAAAPLAGLPLETPPSYGAPRPTSYLRTTLSGAMLSGSSLEDLANTSRGESADPPEPHGGAASSPSTEHGGLVGDGAPDSDAGPIVAPGEELRYSAPKPTPLPLPPSQPLAPPASMFTRAPEPMLLTMSIFPPGTLLAMGGMVSATSVKVIENDDREVREAWWSELRDELLAHAKTLHCTHVIGYTESATIHEELTILHATGTAAQLEVSDLNDSSATGLPGGPDSGMLMVMSAPENEMMAPDTQASPLPPVGERREAFLRGKTKRSMILWPSSDDLKANGVGTPGVVAAAKSLSRMPTVRDAVGPRRRTQKRRRFHPACQPCHIAYHRNEGPFPMSFHKCALCRKHYVPEIVLSTAQVPEGLDVLGGGVLIEAHVCRYKKTKVGESRPSLISESIPFAQYDIHRQLMYKLRIQGLNAVFGLKMQFQVGESLLTMVATGTAMFVRALPSPPALKVFRNLEVLDEEDELLLDIQAKIMHLSEQNRRKIELALAERAASGGGLEGPPGRSALSLPIDPSPLSALELYADTPAALLRGQEGFAPRPIAEEEHPAPGTLTPALDLLAQAASSSSESEEGDQEELEASSTDLRQQQQSAAPIPSLTPRQQQKSVVVQIDDEQDEDLVLLQDSKLSDDFAITPMGVRRELEALTTPDGRPLVCQMVSLVKIGHINEVSHHPNRQFSAIFKAAYQELNHHLSYLSPCILTGLDHDVQLHKDSEIQLSLMAVAFGPAPPPLVGLNAPSSSSPPVGGDASLARASTHASLAEGGSGRPSEVPGAPGPSTWDECALNQLIMDEYFSATEESVNPRYSTWFKIRPISQLTRPGYFSASLGEMVSRGSSSNFPNPTDLVTSMDELSVGDGEAEAVSAGGSAIPAARAEFEGEGGRAEDVSGTLPDFSLPGLLDKSDTINSSQDLERGWAEAYGASGSCGGEPTLRDKVAVDISPLPFMPGARIERHFGRISLHFIKEANLTYEPLLASSGIGGFTHTFLVELHAIIRAHTAALGGNALLSFTADQSLVNESIKNQCYALTSISGDVVRVVRS